ncbi:MAG: serine hydrolase, partial [Clostridia bacterium]|nr:serine hydrolase [Clostridia bacterium]
GVFATSESYARLCRYYMTSDSGWILQAQKEQPESPGRGLGLQTGLTYPYGCGHTGFTGTSIYFSREKNIGCVAFTNRLFFQDGSTHDMSEFRRALHEIVFALGTLNAGSAEN